jgi:hypothetical protein
MADLHDKANEPRGILVHGAAQLVVHAGGATLVDTPVVVLDAEAQPANRPRLRLPAAIERRVLAPELGRIEAGADSLDFGIWLELEPCSTTACAADVATIAVLDDSTLEACHEDRMEGFLACVCSRRDGEHSDRGIKEALEEVSEHLFALAQRPTTQVGTLKREDVEQHIAELRIFSGRLVLIPVTCGRENRLCAIPLASAGEVHDLSIEDRAGRYFTGEGGGQVWDLCDRVAGARLQTYIVENMSERSPAVLLGLYQPLVAGRYVSNLLGQHRCIPHG